jgi:hypothetical protein
MRHVVVAVLGRVLVCASVMGCGGTAAPECGEGTFLQNETCVSVGEVCAQGTMFDGTHCVEDGAGGQGSGDPTAGTSCGPGTVLEGQACVPDGSSAVLACGEGTEEVDGACVASDGDTVSCGEGTRLEVDTCVPSGSETVCGEGTQLSGSECVPEGGLVCGTGTMRSGDECVPATSVTCGDGTELVGQTCVPSETNCGPGTHLYGDLCVTQIPQVPTTATFAFEIAEKGGQVVYFLDELGSAVHRYDLVEKKFLAPLSTADVTAAKMAVTAAGDKVYVGSTQGRINAIDTASGNSSFLGAAAGTLLWMTVTGSYLYTIDDSGAWESHATFSLATGERVFSDEWRNDSHGAFYAPQSKRVFTFRDGTSPNDIYYEEVNQETGALSTDVESPYHGDYQLGHPIRVSPDESSVFVASGVAFNTSDLTYKTSIGMRYTDLTFGGDNSYLLHAKDDDSEVVVLDSALANVGSFTITGKPLRLFVHGDRLTTFTRQGSAIAVSNAPL